MNQFYATAAHARIYAKYRPGPPRPFVEKALDFLKTKLTSNLRLAVDVGCGPGTSTAVLAAHFEHVRGYDISETQISEAKANNRLRNVSFSVGPAENIPVENQSVDLVTVMEAVHWFDVDAFYKEVNRVLVPNGVLAIFGYRIQTPVSKNQARMDSIIENEVYLAVTKKYGIPGARLCQEMYRDVPPIFEDHVRDTMEDVQCTTVGDYVNFIRTLASYQRFLKKSPTEAERLIDRLTFLLMEDNGMLGKNPHTTPLQVKTSFFTLLSRKPGDHSGVNC
ncbi:putative methyltransferase DDB_G0268948 [Haemaphysalis longicornis]